MYAYIHEDWLIKHNITETNESKPENTSIQMYQDHSRSGWPFYARSIRGKTRRPLHRTPAARHFVSDLVRYLGVAVAVASRRLVAGGSTV